MEWNGVFVGDDVGTVATAVVLSSVCRIHYICIYASHNCVIAECKQFAKFSVFIVSVSWRRLKLASQQTLLNVMLLLLLSLLVPLLLRLLVMLLVVVRRHSVRPTQRER